MIYYQKGGKAAPSVAVEKAVAAAAEFGVPVGILLGTCECETNFRLNLVSSANARGPMQFKMKYAEDFYNIAGFRFDIESWDAIRGAAAIFASYARKAEKRGITGDDRWRWALVVFRWGANSAQAKGDLAAADRVRNVEAHMRRNSLWYDSASSSAGTSATAPAAPAAAATPGTAMDVGGILTYSLAEDGETKVAKNFKVKEFRCKDGSDKILIDLDLATLLQKIRDHFNAPVTIVSGYRSPEYNKRCGGAKASKHMLGQAADIKVRGVAVKDVALYAESLGVGGVGAYLYSFTHVDTRTGKKVRWYRVNKNDKDTYVSALKGAL